MFEEVIVVIIIIVIVIIIYGSRYVFKNRFQDATVHT
jgi:uncharacterized protein YxeA